MPYISPCQLRIHKKDSTFKLFYLFSYLSRLYTSPCTPGICSIELIVTYFLCVSFVVILSPRVAQRNLVQKTTIDGVSRFDTCVRHEYITMANSAMFTLLQFLFRNIRISCNFTYFYYYVTK